MKTETVISSVELKQLLIELTEKHLPVCIRYRLIGEMWKEHFFRVVQVTEKGAGFSNEIDNELIFIPDISMIMQFEIDCEYQKYQPHYHYDVAAEGISG